MYTYSLIICGANWTTRTISVAKIPQSYTSSQGKDIPALMLQLFHTDIESF